jgi:hypothetical protein
MNCSCSCCDHRTGDKDGMITVPVGGLSNPAYFQTLQASVQEAILRYTSLNQGTALRRKRGIKRLIARWLRL